MKLRNFLYLCIFGTVHLLSAQTGGTKLERVPESGESGDARFRANLANSQLGSQVAKGSKAAEKTPSASPEVEKVVSPNKAERTKLNPGEASIPLRLADSFEINRIFFRSFSATGTVSVRGANRDLPPDSKKWKTLVENAEFGPKQTVDQKFADATIQWLLFDFNVSIPGDISVLGVMGNEFVQSSSAKPPTAEELDSLPEKDKEQLVPYDFASLVNGSRIEMLSSGSISGAESMIDDDITTFYEFEASDPNVLMILDLKSQYRINKVALTLDTGPGEIEIYAFTLLPEALSSSDADTGSSVVVPDEFFESAFPIAVRTFDEPSNRIELDVDQVDAQFAMLRWKPMIPEGVDFASYVESIQPLRVYEMSFIGMIPDTFEGIQVLPGVDFAPSLAGPTAPPNVPVTVPNAPVSPDPTGTQ